jgi:hypothetical protein
MSDKTIVNSEPEQYPGQREELRKRAELMAAQDRAHAAVLPGALREAFGGEPATAEGHKLEPVTLGMSANLERINSPLLAIMQIMREVYSEYKEEGNKEGNPPAPDENHSPVKKAISPAEVLKEVAKRIEKLKFEEEQCAETVLVFIKPQKQIRKLLDSGRDKFRETAMELLGDKLHPVQMAALQRACTQHYAVSFATIIQYGAPPAPGEGLVFQAPSPSAVTDSAGG